ncbi:MAG TPA: hypothetical protein VG028_11170 [Terriglobia bacterium]|nr:hypothetical protein [Terriglobia bacterium]
MLPDIPRTKEEILKKLQLFMHDKVQELWPLAKMIRSVTQHEGQVHSYEQEGGQIVSQGYEEFASPIEVRIDEVPTLVGKCLMEKLSAVAEDIARKQAALFYQRMTEITTAVGNSIDAQGQPLSQDLFLESLARREVDFDSAGRPKGTIVAGPLMAREFEKKLAEWSQDAAFRKRHEAILSQKHEEWRDRESNRKLVD